MKRTGFKRLQLSRQARVAYKLTRPCPQARVESKPIVVPKLRPVRSEAYRRAVAALPCIRCGVIGYSQAAHPNTGKGAGSKTDDRLCFPLCACRPGIRGCHSLFDQGALFAKARRREVEAEWTAATQQTLSAAGFSLPSITR